MVAIKNRNKKIAVLLFFMLLAYAVWNGRNLILGPIIKIDSPLSGDNVTNPLVTIKGLVRNVSFMSLNGRQIFVDKSGNFSEDVLLLPGYNEIDISAQDRFGKQKTDSLYLYNEQKEADFNNTSTSTKSLN